MSRLAPTQWNGTKTVSGRIVSTTRGRRRASRRAGCATRDRLAVGDAEPAGQHRVQLDERPGVGAARGPGGSARRTGTARAPGRWSGAAGTSASAARPAPRCSTGVRSGPGRRACAKRSANSRGVPGCRPASGQGQNTPCSSRIRVVGDAGVVGRARRPRRGAARRRPRSGSVGNAHRRARAARPARRCTSRSVRTPVGRRDAPAAQDHPALEVGHGAVLLGPLRDGQHDVGERRGLGQHDVGDDQQVERVEPRGDVAGVGRGDDEVGAEDQQRPRAAVGARARRAARTPTAPGRAGTPAVTPHTPATCARAAGSSILR